MQELHEATYRPYADSQYLFGRLLRDGWLPSILRANLVLDVAVLPSIQNEYLYVWRKMISILSFGYNTGQVLHDLLDDDVKKCQSIGYSAASFNLIISLYDYLLDECPSGPAVRTVVSRELIFQLLFGKTQYALAEIKAMIRNQGNPVISLLLSSIYAWIVCTQQINRLYKTRDKGLYAYIIELFDVENKATAYTIAQTGSYKPCMADIQKKSVGPFVTIGKFVAEISHEYNPDGSFLFEDVVSHIGNVFMIADDLSDINNDYDSRAPNSILLGAGSADYQYPLLSEASIKSAVDKSIEKMFEHYSKGISSAKILCNNTQKYADFCEFLMMNIAGWLSIFTPTTDQHS